MGLENVLQWYRSLSRKLWTIHLILFVSGVICIWLYTDGILWQSIYLVALIAGIPGMTYFAQTSLRRAKAEVIMKKFVFLSAIWLRSTIGLDTSAVSGTVVCNYANVWDWAMNTILWRTLSMCYGSLVSYCLPFISPISSFITGFGYSCSRSLFMQRYCICGERYVPIYIIDTEIIG